METAGASLGPKSPTPEPLEPVPVPKPPEPPVSEGRVGFSPGAPDEHAPLYHWGSAGVAASALLLLIGVLLTRRGQVQTDDSEDFRTALEVMRPWIVLGRPTPRLLKRYLNHVRFVAMRQRGDEEPESRSDGYSGAWASCRSHRRVPLPLPGSQSPCLSH